ncbi:Protein of uncharacterised function (DUF2490) [Legionella israelensis]|uniref:DUF2490 domain-containing protein n=1 Tax=Legionella israelensis TaxID=454 RepID=A0A0W0WC36_9GAMM|nr:DUF2490 domain-containing protein [Legionella israelensis]KTD29900.1 hypothetical protein Lisr_0767 [Legionella israelensis]QBS10308.1 DUF2490 domain-containing protein [Legionella israelensis]SCY49686.1 Protein of unknown function [Legionella israelensis DSM 19235]STX59908.1 Protein of uncharacterised function (DUF2490) [Legionella israelensis]
MSVVCKHLLLGFTACVLSFFISKSYSDTVHDFQTWLNLTTTGHFDRESRDFGRFKYWLEGQERVGENSSRFSQTLGRIGLGYTISDNISFWLGYAWIYTGEPFTTQPFHENRVWEQLLWSTSIKRFTFISRTRMEQRFLANGTKTAYRARQLVKLIKPLEIAPNYSIVSSDEIFWHKNNFIGRNGQGFDQNRFFIGFAYQFSPVLSTEVGYMNQYIRRFGAPNFLTNILSVNFFINL